MTRSLSIALALLVAAPLAACDGPAKKDASATSSPTAAASSSAAPVPKTVAGQTVKLPDGLVFTEVKVGTGDAPKTGQTAVVQYVGTFPGGKQFDASTADKPFSFVLGAHQVIPCWDEGVATMRKGGKRKLTCPPALAYGERGAANVIPPNATLDFVVTLDDIK